MINFGIVTAMSAPGDGDELERIDDIEFESPEAARAWADGVSFGASQFGGGMSVYGVFNKKEWPTEQAGEISDLLGLTE